MVDIRRDIGEEEYWSGRSRGKKMASIYPYSIKNPPNSIKQKSAPKL